MKLDVCNKHFDILSWEIVSDFFAQIDVCTSLLSMSIRDVHTYVAQKKRFFLDMILTLTIRFCKFKPHHERRLVFARR